ncbi:PAS domain S-box protein [Ramlibacter sp. G-1-2-2]|uniref:histidine kinase n=1 Tax=Ramlibacter agri TaxID=2728837 RepID=A0A848H6Z0_9BURK|nr:PAS domain S-box protein [Ramlibacter agri]NML45271.1 PAS domain S-box protein [Ramlibacter agri]
MSTRTDQDRPPADALARLALSTARATGPDLLAVLVHELAAALAMPLVLLAVPALDARRTLRTLAVSLDGRSQPNFHLPCKALAGLPTFPSGYQFAAAGALPQLPPRSLFARERMDAVAVLPLTDSCGEALGLLVAMDRQPVPLRAAACIEAMLALVGARAAAEIERARTGETLRAVALAVSESRSGSVFDELVRLLASILQVDVAFIAQPEPAQPGAMRMLALYCGGKVLQDIRYPLAGSPCATVLGHSFRAYPSGVQALFPADLDLRELGSDSYAGHPLVGLDGTPLGIVSVASRQPLAHLDRVKSTLKIFAVRAAAEVERLRAGEAQKQALEGLRQREAQYRAIFESAVDGLFLWNEDLRVVDANPAALALYGYGRDEVVGHSFPRSMPETYVRERLEWVRRALAGQATHLETTVLRPDGSSFEADLRVLPFSHQGRPHALAVVRDISERRQRERELQRSEEQYRSIFNASLDAMVLRAADFSIVDVNDTYQAWTGLTRSEVLGVARVIANPPEVREKIRRLHEEALAGATIRLETQLSHRDGRRRELELRGVPITHRGQPHVLYMGRDITERVAAEHKRSELERQLRQAQKMEAIGQLTGGLAHDFNNLLTSVLGYLAMAQEHAGDARLGHDLDQAQLAAERAREHVAQLLAFSRPRRGERKLLAASQVAGEALQLLRPNLPSSIVVESELAAEAPVLADPVQFEQVLLNLCLNARDAIGEQGTIRLRTFHAAAFGHCASCGARVEGQRWVAFEVADDGRGMSPDVVDRMFEPFFTTKDSGRGTGMGLAMVHGIVHDHGGHVLVATAPGGGSSFRVLLPATGEADDAAGPAAARAAAATLPPLRGRVLLVEDEPFVNRFMQDLMRSWGLEVVPEHDALAAARRLEAPGEAFALLLTDHTMPGMTGLALARHAHRQRPGLPVLMYTGNALAISDEELAASGVHTLLRKPVDCYVLRPLLGELLARGPAA